MSADGNCGQDPSPFFPVDNFSRQVSPASDYLSRQESPVSETEPLSPASSSTSKISGFRDRTKLTISTTRPSFDPPAAEGLFKTLRDGETIADYYEFQEEIYNGGEKGKVLVAVQKKDGCEVVVKIRVRSTNRVAERNWRTIMLQVNGIRASEHVLGITRIYEDEKNFYVVMPRCNGGEFFEFLATEAEISEGECKRITREILTAVGHLHDNNLLHRDIKPENIMFNQDPSSPKAVKLIDFDTCAGYAPDSPKNRHFVGTPGFIAPEALQGQICPQSDLWSVGVILYILITGEMPWTSSLSLEDGVVGSPKARKMYRGLKTQVFDWDLEPWPQFPLARDLCQKLLAFEVQDRLQDFREALAHPWLDQGTHEAVTTNVED